MTTRPTLYRRWLSPEGYLGLHLAVGFMLALLAGWAFAAVAEDVVEVPGGLPSDELARDLVTALNHPERTRVMRAISIVGKPIVLTPLSLGVALWLLAIRSHRRLYAFLATMLGGSLLNLLLKVLFARARPSGPTLASTTGFSFPSGHAMGSLLFFGSLAYVLYFTLEVHHVWRLVAVFGCGAAALAVGASRIYLGVHYLTDVIAGFFAALCWMGVCLSGTEAWVRWRDWRRRRRPPAAGLVLLALAFAPPLEADMSGSPLALPCAECLVWEADPSQAESLLAADQSITGMRLLVWWPADADLLRRLAHRGVETGLVWTMPAGTGTPVPDATSASTLLVAPVALASAPPGAAAFHVKDAVTRLRARQPSLSIGLLGPAWLLREVAAYVDFAVAEDPAEEAPVVGSERWSRAPGDLSVPALLRRSRMVRAERLLVSWPGTAEVLRLQSLRPALPAGLTPFGGVSLSCRGHRGVTPCPAEAFLDPRDASVTAILHKPEGVTRVEVHPAAKRIRVHHVSSGDGPATVSGSRLETASAALDLVLRLEGLGGGRERFATGVEVVAEKVLSVEEIIARHQAAAARQRTLVRQLIAAGSTVITFQAPGLAAPVTISSASTLYQGADVTEIEHRDIRLNGVEAVRTGNDGVPRLPMLEPERVAQPPLAIALDESYAYRLEGREQVEGHDSYVVGFAPRAPASGRPLFRGRAWIEGRGFGLVRLQAAQTGLRGPIVSAEQEETFVPVTVDGDMVWLLARSEAHQAYEGPGHRTPIHRVVRYERHEPNPRDLAERLAAAHASPSVMMRETDRGFRYLRRLPASAPEAARGRAIAPPATRVRTLAAGVLVDPNISVPLPFAGVSYVDFDFLRTGGQFSGFFALAFAQASWSVPQLFGGPWQLQGSAFGTLAEYNDRSFRGGLERYEENVRQRPARLSLGLVRPLGARARLRAGYELSYTRLRASDTTAADFVVPPSPLVHALRLGLEGQRGGWTASAWWSPARRQRWHDWGRSDATSQPAEETIGFQRYGASLSRSFVLSPVMVGRLEASWMAGRDLDRFSRYTFDAFENRLRGYPTASVRFDRGGVGRAVLTWSPAARLRLDAFADTAFVRDPGLGPRHRAYPGLGAGLEAPLPHVGLVAAEWGYGFEGRDVDGRRGTHVFRLTAYRVF